MSGQGFVRLRRQKSERNPARTALHSEYARVLELVLAFGPPDEIRNDHLLRYLNAGSLDEMLSPVGFHGIDKIAVRVAELPQQLVDFAFPFEHLRVADQVRCLNLDSALEQLTGDFALEFVNADVYML